MRLRSRRTLWDCINALNRSERDLARTAGIGHSTLNHLASGRRDTCSLATAQAIERVLGCAPGTLFIPDTEADRAALHQRQRCWAGPA